MIAQYERLATAEMSEKALRLLVKAGNPLPRLGNSTYTYFLTVRDRAENDLSMDAILRVDADKIMVLAIWEMILDTKTEVLAARNKYGEKGAYGSILAQKYIDAFLVLVENIGIDSLSPLRALMHERK